MPFSRLSLLLRNLRHFRGANVAVVAGMAVATAVLAGALMVGDSVRGSLRDLADRRLAWVDHALVSPRMTSETLADRLKSADNFTARFEAVTPGLLMRGGASLEGAKAKVPGVDIVALRDREAVEKGEVLVNTELAKNLGLVGDGAAGRAPQAERLKGDAIRFSLPAPDAAPKDSTLARRGRNETITSLTAERTQLVEPNSFRDLFTLTGGQRATRTAWASYADVQEQLELEKQANVFLVQAKPGHGTADDANALNAMVKAVAKPEDYGLDVAASADKKETVLSSKATYVHPAVIDAADALAKARGAVVRKVSVYLINHVVRTDTADATPLHYAIAAGVSDLGLAADEVAVNQWTADQMKLKVGDRLRLDYFVRQPNGDLAEVRSDRPEVALTFRVARVLPMDGIGADPTMTPAYKGLTDADSIADWRPPAGLTIDKKLVTQADEDYWDKYKAAPKLFVSLDSAAKLWGGAFGDVTSLRVPADKAGADFAAELARRIDPAAVGLTFRAARAQQVSAASGGTDFGEYFLYFSFFLLVAAVMLVAMLFRLSVEQRARQLGLLAACGFAPRQLRNLALREGMLLAILGALLGTGLAIGYTALIVHGLRTWWVGAIGTTALRLHVAPVTLAYGVAGSVVVALLAILWAVRRVGKSSPAALLHGVVGPAANRLAGPPKKSLAAAAVAALCAAGLFAAGVWERIPRPPAFLGGGAVLLLAALLVTFARLRPRAYATATLSVPALAARNATRNRTRSLLCVALIALASYTLVTVSAFETGVPDNTYEKASGAGGFALIVQADIPLLGDLNSPDGRKVLMRQASANDPRWALGRFAMMRTWRGQDISCLNITRPDSPTILAAPKLLTEEGRFTFGKTLRDVKNPWTLLDEPVGPDGAIPVIADAESAAYVLKLAVGDTMPLTDAAGRPRKLKLVATLSGSVFQSEMLMSERNFLDLFPAQAGYSTILVECAKHDEAAVAALLAETLNDVHDQEKSDYSASIDTTASRLATYHEVVNTYLATFRVLGSLGLMLGTIGLAVVLVRNLIERRPELALLAALGFSPGIRRRLVLWENMALLFLGMGIGAACALAGVIPNSLTSSHRMNVPALAVALGAVIVVGVASLLIAVAAAGRRVTPAALRAE